MRRLTLALAALLSVFVLATPAAAQLTPLCGVGAAAVCNPSSVLEWIAPTTNADAAHTPLVDLAGYNVLWCDSAPCTRATAGVLVKDIGLPATSCISGRGDVRPAPCVVVSTLGLPTVGGLRFAAIEAYDTAPVRNTSVPSVTYGPFAFSPVVPDLTPPSAPSTPAAR